MMMCLKILVDWGCVCDDDDEYANEMSTLLFSAKAMVLFVDRMLAKVRVVWNCWSMNWN